ncbi:MAG: flavodoxin [Lachnospirales bacterium]
MSNIAVIYWSGTGNTEKMANAICEGANGILFEVSDFSLADVDSYDKFIFGCPAMGAEVLEDSVFEPFFSEIENKLMGKKVALFGSYGWGDGQWMRDWEERVVSCGASLFENGLIINDCPDDDSLENCKKFGKRFSEF